MRIVHLSDLHIGKSDNAKKCRYICQWLISNKEVINSSVIAITGDVVDDGALWQYKEAERFVSDLKANGFTVLAVPGNHDYGCSGIIENDECIGYFKKYIAGNIDYPHCITVSGCSFILLDSMLQEMREEEIWGAQGKLGKAQLRDLDKLLNDLADNDESTKVIVLLHHHPFYYEYLFNLRDDELFKKVIIKKDGTSRANCLLFGHKHVERRLNDQDDNKEIKYNIDIVFASGSTTERDESGKFRIPIIDLSNNTIEIHSS